MAVLWSLGGNTLGDGFLVAPFGTNYDAELALWSDAGNVAVTLLASPNPAGLDFSQSALNLTAIPSIVQVHSTLQSASRGDTTIQVLDGINVLASFTVTSINHPVVNFKGRFEARFATDGALYNANPIYTAVLDNVVPPGWTWGLEGEPSFVPPMNNVPENLVMPVGRVVRLNNPAALRSHAAPVVSTVASISGATSAGTETFLTGDPIIGQPFDFGPDTYLAGNNSFGSPQPEEYYSAAFEPMALFEIRIGNGALYFRGKSGIGPFTHKATFENEQTRTPDSRPVAAGLVGASSELAEFSLPATLQTFSETRIDQLVVDYAALPAGDSTQRRNLKRRIGHLLASVGSIKRNAVLAANPGEFFQRQGTLPQGWPNKEVYNGKIDADLHALPGGSSVIAYFTEFFGFDLQWNPFGFHSDELCGYHKGTLKANLSMHGGHIGDPHTQTVDGTSYDFQGVGEFTLLRDGEGFEIQVRQTPVATQHPITDGYSGLTSCVSINTAVAIGLGQHRISLQPGKEGKRLQFWVDGKRAPLPFEGLELGSDRVTAIEVGGETGVRVDAANQTVVIVSPHFWTSYQVWYLNVEVAHTQASAGVMGIIPQGSWLPRLRSGETLGVMPGNLSDRWVELYQKYADSWRIDDAGSLFVYEGGQTTKAFSEPGWPAETAPCQLDGRFEVAGAPELVGMKEEEAEQICSAVIDKELHRNCVFDVATIGEEEWVKGYLVAQDLRLFGTRVELVGNEPPTQPNRTLGDQEDRSYRIDHSQIVTATVVPLIPGRPTPTGTVTFSVDGIPVSRPKELDARGRAELAVPRSKPEEPLFRRRRGKQRRVVATYAGGGKFNYLSSTSSVLLFTEAKLRIPKPQ